MATPGTGNGNRIANHSANLISGLAGASSAGVSACAGGVCALAAQSGAAWAAGSAAGLAGAGASGAGWAASDYGSYPWWNPDGPATARVLHHGSSGLPWWAMLALVLLWISTTWTVQRLSGTPRAAWLAALGSILITVGDLHWVPGGTPVTYTLLGFGMMLLIGAPLMPSWHPRKCVAKAVRITLIAAPLLAIAWAFWLQIDWGWQPCALCWLERGVLLAVAIAAARNRPLWPLVFAGLGLSAVMAQILEESRSGGQAAHALIAACGAIGPSCAGAGARMLWGWPVAWWTAALFIGLSLLGVLQARKWIAGGGPPDV